ncbi:MAG TPA: NAD(P)-dependent alcohol dehydrogenase [Candidatus Dormibacteraeota bacterium]
MQITAAVTEAKGAPFAVQPVELGDLRDDEVLVRVAAVGICHTDLIVRDQWIPVPLPAVLGHEGAGIVERVGASVSDCAPGDRVAMSFHSCGRCHTCRSGRPAYCMQFFEHNFAASRPGDASSVLSRNGQPLHAHFFGQSSFATHAVASERNIVRIDGDIPLDIAAPFGCGIQTGAGAVLNVVRPAVGSSIAIFGTGAVGLAAVLAAVVAGCTTIIGIDRSATRLRLARELGATDTVDVASGDAGQAVVGLTGGGVDNSLETTGSPAVFRQAVDCLAPTGTCGLIGAAALGTEVAFDMTTILVGGRVVRGIVEGDSVPQLFLPMLVRLWEAGRFPIDRLMRWYDLDQIDEAAHDAEAGRVIKPVLRVT